MTVNEALGATQSNETDGLDPNTPDGDAVSAENVSGVDNEDGTITYKRYDIERMRRESNSYRERAQAAEARADELAARLHTALVTATGKLADPSDLPFDPTHLDDVDQLNAAIDTLIDSKPHLKAREFGPVGQGKHTNTAGPQDFSELFR